MKEKLSKRNKIILAIVTVSLLAVFSVLTYAFFSAGGVTNNATDSNVTTLTSNYGSIYVRYPGGRIINSEDVVLIEDEGDSSDILKFSIQNTGTVSQDIVVGWSDLINNFCHYINSDKECTDVSTDTSVMNELNYTLYECTDETSYNDATIGNLTGCTNNLSDINTSVPLTGGTDLMHTQEKITINRETTRYFVFQLTLENLSAEQNYNQNRNMSGRILVNYKGKTIEGDLEDNEGNTKGDTKIRMLSLPITTYTDSEGHFKFTNVPLGNHTIEVTENDVTKTGSIEIREASEFDVTNNVIGVAGTSASIKAKVNNTGVIISKRILTLAQAIETEYPPVSDLNIDFSYTSAGCDDWDSCAAGTIENASQVTNGLYINDKDNIGSDPMKGKIKYFRGNVDNYVEFAGLTWRVIRINEDGNVRIITENNVIASGSYSKDAQYNNAKYVGYTTDRANETAANTSRLKTELDSWYTNTLETDYSSYINTEAQFCNDTSPGTGPNSSYTYFNGYTRIYTNFTPTFNCPSNQNSTYGGIYTLPVGTITADEAAYAGGKYNVRNNTYYLNNSTYYWTMSPYYFTGGFANEVGVNSPGVVNDNGVRGTTPGGRAVIELNTNTLVTGEGTSEKPWVVQ